MILRRNQKNGVPMRETAAQLGRTYYAVRGYASDMGFLQPQKGWTLKQEDRAFYLKRIGFTSKEIGEELKKSAENVRKFFWRQRHGKV